MRLDGSGGAVVVCRDGVLSQKLAAHGLVESFCVVVGHVLLNKMSQVGFAKHYEVIEALISDGLDEALSMRITVWALRRDGDARDVPSQDCFRADDVAASASLLGC